MSQEDELLTVEEVRALLKVSRPAIYLWVRTRGFPKPVKVGQLNRWFAAEVREWLAKQPRARVKGQMETIGRDGATYLRL